MLLFHSLVPPFPTLPFSFILPPSLLLILPPPSSSQMAYCDKCEDRIWGLGRQGYRCESCKMTVHKGCCYYLKPDDICKGHPVRNPSLLLLSPSSSLLLLFSPSSSSLLLLLLLYSSIRFPRLWGLSDYIQCTPLSLLPSSYSPPVAPFASPLPLSSPLSPFPLPSPLSPLPSPLSPLPSPLSPLPSPLSPLPSPLSPLPSPPSSLQPMKAPSEIGDTIPVKKGHHGTDEYSGHLKHEVGT